MPRDIHHLHGVGIVGQIKLDLFVIQNTVAQFFAEHFAGLIAGIFTGQRVNHAFFGCAVCFGFHVLAQLFTHHQDGTVHQVTHNLFDVTANVAHFGKLGCLDFQERGVRQFGQSAAYFGFTDTGRPDHQDVLGVNLVTQIIRQLPATPAVTQGHSHGAFGVVLADDVAIQFGYDFTGGKVSHAAS